VLERQGLQSIRPGAPRAASGAKATKLGSKAAPQARRAEERRISCFRVSTGRRSPWAFAGENETRSPNATNLGAPYEKHGRLAAQSDLPDTVYAFPRQRKEPLTDARHVRNADARFTRSSAFLTPIANWPSQTSKTLRKL
jgi:hypothetical protein